MRDIHDFDKNHGLYFMMMISTMLRKPMGRMKPSRAQRGLSRLCIRMEQGSSTVEFALVLPLLLFLVTGMLSMGFFLENYLTLTDSVAIGGRNLAVIRGTAAAADPCNAAATAINNAAFGLNPSSMTFSFTITGPGGTPTGTNYTTSCTSLSPNIIQGGTAQIKASYPCSFLAVFSNSNFMSTSSCRMTAAITELIQ